MRVAVPAQTLSLRRNFITAISNLEYYPDLRELDAIDLWTLDDRAMSLAVTPDGKTLVAGTARGVLLIFELRLE